MAKKRTIEELNKLEKEVNAMRKKQDEEHQRFLTEFRKYCTQEYEKAAAKHKAAK